MIRDATRPRRLQAGRGVAAVVATGLLLAGCGGGGAGAGLGGPTPPTERSFEELKIVPMGTWDACELLGDHLREFTEFLDYERFRKDLVSLNGSATGGIRMCHGHAIWYDDPAKSEIADLAGDISFGFGRVDQASDLYADTEYRTPTGRYYERAQLRRDLHEDKSVAERSEDGPWDEATVLLGDTGTGTTLSAFILDAERDFMLELSVSLDGASSRARLADELTWTLEEAAKHFREVTMRNAYQEMVDRIDAVS